MALVYDQILIVALFSPWIIMSIFSGNALLGLAIIIGLILVVPGTHEIIRSDINFIKYTLECVIFIAILFLFLQLLLFYFFGEYFDFTSLLGSIEGRGYRGYGLFRPHGTMQEPNAYSTVVLVLLYLYSKLKKVKHWLVNLAFVSVLLSLSLWGVLMVPIFYLFFYRNLFTNKALFIVVIILVFFSSEIYQVIENTNIIERLDFSSEDSSRNVRYGNIQSMFDSKYILTGQGFNSNIFQKYGANGIAFLLNSLGLIGVVIMSIVLMVQKALLLRDVMMLGLIFTTFPITSYMFLYVTIGSIIGINRLVCAEY